MSVTRTTQHQRGFSLVEALAALAVFSVGLLGVLHMNVLASQQNGVARRQSTASKLGRDLVDAFERLPYDHPLLANESTLAPNAPAFANIDAPEGRVWLSNALTVSAGRPLLGAAQAIASIEGRTPTRPTGIYEVAWRTTPVKDSHGETEARRILVMVRFPTTGGTYKQINMWTMKFNPAVMGQGSTAVPEI
jgi:type IV pilus assembly protein PilV